MSKVASDVISHWSAVLLSYANMGPNKRFAPAPSANLTELLKRTWVATPLGTGLARAVPLFQSSGHGGHVVGGHDAGGHKSTILG